MASTLSSDGLPLVAMSSTLLAMASHLVVMDSNVIAMASTLVAMASTLVAGLQPKNPASAASLWASPFERIS